MSAKTDGNHVFVLDRYIGLFLSAEGYWTSERSAARDFCATPHAVAHCLAQNIAEAQIAIAREGREEQGLTVLRLPRTVSHDSKNV